MHTNNMIGSKLRCLVAVLLMATAPGLAMADQTNGELEIRKLADNVYLHTSFKKLPGYGYFPSNGLVVIDGTDAYIIDTAWRKDDTEVLVKWIEQAGFTPKASLSTHSHDDRSSGVAYLNARNVKTYASEQTNGLLKAAGKETAAHIFAGDEFTLLKGRIHVYYPGKGHSEDNLVVWLPDSGVLFGGCLIRDRASGNLGYTADASLADWATTVQNVIDRFPEVKTVVPGHGATGGPELLGHTKELAAQAATPGNSLH